MAKKKTTKKTKAVTDTDNPPPTHKPGGGFAKGNKLGKGNPNWRRLASYRKTINEAVTPAMLKKVIAVLVKKAQGGDLVAVKELLDRTVGKVSMSQQRAESAELTLPELTSTKDTVTASNAILRGMNEGRVTPDDAARLMQVVELARRAIETHELASEVEELRSIIERKLR